MKKSNNTALKLTASVLIIISCFIYFVSCNYDKQSEESSEIDYTYSKTVEGMTAFGGSDSGISDFLNSYYAMHMRTGDTKIAQGQIGAGSMFMKEWETLGCMWGNATTSGLDYSAQSNIESWLNIPIDKFGYVWSGMRGLASTTATNVGWYQGWPFPDYTYSKGNSTAFLFNGTKDGKWESNVSGAKQSGGLYTIPLSDTEDSFYMSSDYFTPVACRQAPFLAVEFRINDTNSTGEYSSLENIYIYYQTDGDENFSEEKKVSLKENATFEYDEIPKDFNEVVYFPMYLENGWDNITKLKVVYTVKEGKSFSGTVSVNHIMLDYDSRQANNNTNYLQSLYYYFSYTNNLKVLKDNLNKARQALMFFTEVLGGAKNNLIDCSYLAGHDGVRGIGHGIGNGFNDIISLPSVDFYTNVYYVKALRAMIYIEKIAESINLDVGSTYIYNGENSSEKITYNYNSEKLTELLNNTVNQMQKEYIEPVVNSDGEYSFNYQGGFWSSEKGRFTEGFNSEGEKIDYGYTAFNLEGIVADIATDSQAEQIMDWISGKRIISGETAQGVTGNAFGNTDSTCKYGIYDFEFAPRFSTIRNEKHYMWEWTPTYTGFGEQVQDGGVMAWTAYYDIMARLKVYGADNAYAQLKKIQSWYNKVESAAADADVGGKLPWSDFYTVYYDSLGLQLQGGGTAGGIGLKDEFYEAIILSACVPMGFFGLEQAEYNTLGITPDVSNNGSYYTLENLLFGGIKYDVAVGYNFVEIDSVSEIKSDYKIKITFDKPNGNFNLLINGKAVDNSYYKIEGNKLIVTVPFKQCRITVKI